MAALGRLLDPIRLGSEAEVLESKLRKRVVGQNEAIHQIVGVYQTFLAGLTTPGTPIGSFLFLGPTGSGKTRTVEARSGSTDGRSARDDQNRLCRIPAWARSRQADRLAPRDISGIGKLTRFSARRCSTNTRPRV